MHELIPAAGWITPPVVRLPAPKPSERGVVLKIMSLLGRRFGRQQLPDVFSVFHINARLFWAWLFFASRLMPYGRLSGRVREMIILRTAWNCRSRYEWGQHVDLALSAGVSDAEIVKVSQGPNAFSEPVDNAIMLACDEVFADKYISDSTWRLLSAHYNSKRLIEIMILIGHYVMLAAFLNSAGIALEPPIEEKLQAFHGRIHSS